MYKRMCLWDILCEHSYLAGKYDYRYSHAGGYFTD